MWALANNVRDNGYIWTCLMVDWSKWPPGVIIIRWCGLIGGGCVWSRGMKTRHFTYAIMMGRSFYNDSKWHGLRVINQSSHFSSNSNNVILLVPCGRYYFVLPYGPVASSNTARLRSGKHPPTPNQQHNITLIQVARFGLLFYRNDSRICLEDHHSSLLQAWWCHR